LDTLVFAVRDVIVIIFQVISTKCSSSCS